MNKADIDLVVIQPGDDRDSFYKFQKCKVNGLGKLTKDINKAAVFHDSVAEAIRKIVQQQIIIQKIRIDESGNRIKVID